MPQTIVREFDETRQVTSAYSNFTVVVPGFIGEVDTDLAVDYADVANAGKTDGIYEISSVKAFRGVIGYCNAESVSASEATDPYGPKLEEFMGEEYTGDDLVYNTITAATFIKYFTGDNAGLYNLYKRSETKSAGTAKKLDDGTNIYVEVDIDELDDSTKYSIIHTGTYEDETTGKEKYYIGADAETAADSVPAQYGNQIAYELVKSGYTVLYVSLGKWSELTTDALKIAALNKLKAKPTDDNSIWAPLLDRTAYDFRYVISGLFDASATSDFVQDVYVAMGRLVTFINDKYNKVDTDHQGRGDCIALLDVPESIYTAAQNGYQQRKAIAAIKSFIKTNIYEVDASNIGKYCAIFAPEVIYNMSIADCEITIGSTVHHYVAQDYQSEEVNLKDITHAQRSFPTSVHYLLCAAYARENNIAEYWANAGESRGLCKYKVLSTTVRIGEVGINELEPRYTNNSESVIKKAVNPTALIHGTYYLYGSRTAENVSTDADTDLKASHFLNIRELCTTLKKLTYKASFVYRFDPNSDLLWVKFCNYIRPTLEAMKGNQGILDYKFEKLATSKKAKLRGKIRIVPVEPVEDFDLGLYLEDSVDGEVASLFED